MDEDDQVGFFRNWKNVPFMLCWDPLPFPVDQQ